MSKEESQKDNSFGVASLVLGLISTVFLFFFPLGLILGLVGLIFGFVQRRKHKNPWATWGIVLSIIGIVLGILFAYTILSGISQMLNSPEYQQLLQQAQQAQELANSGLMAN